MSKPKFAKITKLNIPESFFQVNLVNGFKYIDKAGGVIKLYHEGDEIPSNWALDLREGLFLSNPTKNIDSLRLTYSTFWAKYKEVGTLDSIYMDFCKNMENVLGIIEVASVSRVGWRNHFIYEFSGKEDKEAYFNNLVNLKSSKLSTIVFNLEEGKIKANLTIQSVIKSNDSTKSGILFDTDVYITDKIEVSSVKSQLKSLLDFIKSDKGILGAINETFDKRI